MDNFSESQPLKALLIGVQLPKVSDQETQASLAELERLVNTLGYEVVGQTSQKRSSTRSATVLGEGKLKDIAKWTGGPGFLGPLFKKKKHKAALRFEKEEQDEFEVEEEFEESDEPEILEEDPTVSAPQEKAQVAIFDCELSPSQLRNMEHVLGVPVLDRTGVIIEIFNRHARTREAKLQVEIARLRYVAPRLRETSGGEDRGGGGIGAKGAGESVIELDRRHIRDRIKELKDELASIAQEHETRRARRSQELVVALVGYTNAGKSSLMRALTGSEIYVADKLFATLDTTVRTLYPETKPKVLISDTVGFIKKLPHDLVASFKSTLDEALNASLLLYVVDCADSTFRSQLEVTKSTLQEVGAGQIDSILVLNKVDRLSLEERAIIAAEFPQGYFLSAHSADDIAKLREHLIKHFENAMVEHDFLIPYDVQGAIGDIRAKFAILGEEYDNRGLTLKVRAAPEDIRRIKTRYGI